MKKRLAVVAIIVLLLVSTNITPIASFIRYDIINDHSSGVLLPITAFYFSDETADAKGTLYELIEQDTYGNQIYDKRKDVYYLQVAQNFLNNDNVSLYASGEYWNISGKPVVKVNGNMVERIEVENAGSQGIFIWSKIFCDKIYHATYDDTIVADTLYEFYVRCGNEDTTIRVVFTDNLRKHSI